MSSGSTETPTEVAYTNPRSFFHFFLFFMYFVLTTTGNKDYVQH